MRDLSTTLPTNTERWFAVLTKQHRESQAKFHLSRKGIEAYVPTIRLWPPPAVGREVQPLFPGYMFARLDLLRDHHTVIRTPGVKSFVSFGEAGPAEMPAEAVSFLRSKEGEDGSIHCEEDVELLGLRVEVVHGPLREFRGVVARRLSATERVVILLDFLQPDTHVELPVAWLKRDAIGPR